MLDTYNGHDDEHMDAKEAQRYKQVNNFQYNLLRSAVTKNVLNLIRESNYSSE